MGYRRSEPGTQPDAAPVENRPTAVTDDDVLRLVSESRREGPAGSIRTRRFWRGPAIPTTVGQARRVVAEFAAAGGVSGIRIHDVRACVSEAVTNSVLHAFHDGRRVGIVTVSAGFSGDTFTITVTDDGSGLLPRDDSPGSGLGLPTIRELSDSTSVLTGARGGTQLTMTFDLVAESSLT
jgi:serine/threonine-protein kinase RsbW